MMMPTARISPSMPDTVTARDSFSAVQTAGAIYAPRRFDDDFSRCDYSVAALPFRACQNSHTQRWRTIRQHTSRCHVNEDCRSASADAAPLREIAAVALTHEFRLPAFPVGII